ncbi:hypothetical protein [Zavarzinella formosa]|uniref:hypothetical protein n=1 Tax=Zavarzinella formosa TaxID=360055 RepID=UPI0012F91E45|nr:hypothetical protein [Zavarzinella formosa]
MAKVMDSIAKLGEAVPGQSHRITAPPPMIAMMKCGTLQGNLPDGTTPYYACEVMQWIRPDGTFGDIVGAWPGGWLVSGSKGGLTPDATYLAVAGPLWTPDPSVADSKPVFISGTGGEAAFGTSGIVNTQKTGDNLQYLGNGPKAIRQLVLPNMIHSSTFHPETYIDGDVTVETTTGPSETGTNGGGSVRIKQIDQASPGGERSIDILDLVGGAPVGRRFSARKKAGLSGASTTAGDLYSASYRVPSWYDTGTPGSDGAGLVISQSQSSNPEGEGGIPVYDAVSLTHGAASHIPFFFKTGTIQGDLFSTVTYPGGTPTFHNGAAGVVNTPIGQFVNGILTFGVTSVDGSDLSGIIDGVMW